MPPPRRRHRELPDTSPAALHAYLVQPTQTKWLRIDEFDLAEEDRIRRLCKVRTSLYDPGTQPSNHIYKYNGPRMSLRVFSTNGGIQPWEAWCTFPYPLSVADVRGALQWGLAHKVVFKFPWSVAARQHDFITQLMRTAFFYYSLDASLEFLRGRVWRLFDIELVLEHMHRLRNPTCFEAIRNSAAVFGPVLRAVRQMYIQQFDRLPVLLTPDLWSFRHWNVAARRVLPRELRLRVARFLQT